MTRDTRRWIALLAGPVAVIGIAVAGAVFSPDIRAPEPNPHPITFDERWHERVTVPLAEVGTPAWWAAEDGTLQPVQGLRPGLPFPVPVRTIPVKP
jgi:hypothetical protein